MRVQERIRRILSQKTCVVGIGNPYRSDDAAGVRIAEMLADELARSPELAHRIDVVNAEDVLENYVFRLAESACENILLVDAIRCAGAERGSVILGKLEELEELAGGISTHKLALATSGQILKSRGKQVYLLGIVAEDLDYGTRISAEVAASAQAVVEMLSSAEGVSHG